MMDANGREPVTHEIRSLTGLRGVAALYVVVYHVFAYRPAGGSPHIVQAIMRATSHGYIAVDLFFILSGFVMALSYKPMFDGKMSIERQMVFLGRRLARIYPLYFFVSLLSIAAVLLHHSRLSPMELGLVVPANLAMVQTWTAMKSLEGPMWSISAEWTVYLVFPLLLRASFGRRSVALGAFATCGLALAALTLFPGWADPTNARRGGPLNLFEVPAAMLTRCAAEFVIGLLMFRLSQGLVGRRLASSTIASVVIAALIVALLPWTNSDLLLVGCFAVGIVSISADSGPVSVFLGSRIVYTLGIWSYAIYLIHPLVRQILLPDILEVTRHFVRGSLAFPVAAFVALSVLLGLSAGAYQLIEKPGRRAIKALISRTRLRGPHRSNERRLPERTAL